MANANIDTNGFVVEVGETTVKFSTLERGIIERPIMPNQEVPVLAGWYNIFEKDYAIRNPVKMANLRVWSENNELFVQTVAIRPSYFALPKAMRKKFRFAVWSPILQYLNDKEFIFAKQAAEKACGVILKYAPSGNTLFEIVDIVEAEEMANSVIHMSPWALEYLALHSKPVHEVRPDEMTSINRRLRVATCSQRIGVCIAHKWENPRYSETTPGSTKFCAWLWNQIGGLTRWINTDIQPGHEHEMLGNWYLYRLNDTRRKNPNPSLETVEATTATDVVKVEPEKRMKIIKTPLQNWNEPYDYQLQMEVSFPLRRADIEEPGFGVTQIEFSVRNDAHFFEIELGRVDVPVKIGEFMLKMIDNHKTYLRNNDPEEFSRLEDECMIITSTVCVKDDFYHQSFSYPASGLFYVKYVHRINYLHGGEIIFENN